MPNHHLRRRICCIENMIVPCRNPRASTPKLTRVNPPARRQRRAWKSAAQRPADRGTPTSRFIVRLLPSHHTFAPGAREFLQRSSQSCIAPPVHFPSAVSAGFFTGLAPFSFFSGSFLLGSVFSTFLAGSSLALAVDSVLLPLASAGFLSSFKSFTGRPSFLASSLLTSCLADNMSPMCIR